MKIKKLLSLLLLILFLLPYSTASSTYLPSYQHWNFSGENFTTQLLNSSLMLSLQNGVAMISTKLLQDLKKGMEGNLNISVKISPETIIAGLKILVGNDTIMEKRVTKSGRYSLDFHMLKDYKKGENFTIVVYNIGGSITLTISPIDFKVPKGGAGEGLLLSGIGISVVFLVLGILAAIMYALKYLVKEEISLSQPSQSKEKGEKVEKEEKREIGKEEGIDRDTVAAIMGALSLYFRGRKFKIISIKPSPWKYYGRLKNMRRWK